MGEMAAAVAHEINQPLTAIAAHAETARLLYERDGGKPEALGGVLGRIRDEAVRAGEVIRRIRQLAGRGGGERHSEDLNVVVREAAAPALVGARDLGIEPEVRLAHEPVRVVCDRIQIQQVVINLIRNAIDALTDCAPPEPLRPKRIEVEVRTRGADAVVIVRDTGPGVPEPVRTRLFEAFTTTKHNGMGIGLSISRTIAEAHGGELTLEPASAEGAAFRLRLPVAAA